MIKITHPFVSGKADGPDTTQVKPSNWNEDHTVETDGGGGMVVGRETAGGPGALQELPLGYDITGAIGRWVAAVVGSFRWPRGTTAQRPVDAVAGEVRWNTTLGVPEIFDGVTWQVFQLGVGVVTTGMIMGWYSNTLPAAGGWLFLNGQTIGGVGSGADKAGAAYEALFLHFWNSLSDTVAPVSGGRGASAAADWAAAKNLKMPDECGRVTAGADNMGGIVSKDRLKIADNPAGVDGNTIGASGGEQRHQLTIAELASHNHATSVLGVPGEITTTGGGGNLGATVTSMTGGDTPHNTVQPTIIRNSIVKL